jgi:hypothetical protein
MIPTLPVTAVGHATGLTLALAFALCVGFDLLFPGLAMYQAWQQLLPGFTWLSWSSFVLGLAESYGYGWFFALIWTPLFNLFAGRARDRVEPT